MESDTGSCLELIHDRLPYPDRPVSILDITPLPNRRLAKVAAPAEITALATKHWAAKQAKDFAGADALRKELTAAGWSMLDGKDGYSLEPVKK